MKGRPSIKAYLRTARPRQWSKNVLVAAAPAAAGVLFAPVVFTRVALTFAAFCLLSAATYFLNDAADVESDRLHPMKRGRPVAAGLISPRQARIVGIYVIAIGLGLALVVSLGVLAAAAAYVVLTTSYSTILKHEPVLDLMAVTGGFLMRAVAGGVAAEVPLSQWFVVVVGFGSLFIVAVKRSSERRSQEGGSGTRRVLSSYTDQYLGTVRTAALAVTLLAYALWSFERADASAGSFPWFGISILPVAYGLLRYELLAETIGAEAPEDLILGDRGLLIAGAIWLVLFGTGVALG